MSLPLNVHSATHVGLHHERNEDSHDIVPTPDGGMLLLVCDGMGGMGRGDQASAMAIDELRRNIVTKDGPPQVRMREAICTTDAVVRAALCSGTGGRAGATAVLAYVVEGMAHIAWVGDSRAYWIRGEQVVERTCDHKLIDELVARGELSKQEALESGYSNVITRALGGRPPTAPPVVPASTEQPWCLKNGDRILLCTDGLCDLVDDNEVCQLVMDGELESVTKRLIDIALERGGHDNITVIVASWEGESTPDLADDDEEWDDEHTLIPGVTFGELEQDSDTDESLFQEEEDSPTLIPDQLADEEPSGVRNAPTVKRPPSRTLEPVPEPEQEQEPPVPTPTARIAALAAVAVLIIIIVGLVINLAM
jgi:PPM family protein phosphatase